MPARVHMQTRDLHILGEYAVMSILHVQKGFPFLSKSVFAYLTTGLLNATLVTDDEIPSGILKFTILKVMYLLQRMELKVPIVVNVNYFKYFTCYS